MPSRGRLGRNQPCWCGSGVKFKHCHLNRAREEPVTHQENIRDIRRAKRAHDCLHPEASPSNCSGKAIQSHTISQASLRKIAENGHVLSFDGEYDTLVKTNGDLLLKSVGIRSASAFPAFCERHDATTFSAIEAHLFKPCAEHAFLSSYRALCRELFYVIIRKHLPLSHLDRGMTPEGQQLVQALAQAQAKSDHLALSSLHQFKAIYDRALITRSFSSMNFYLVEFDSAPDVMMTSMFAPFADFAGRRLRHKDVLGTTDDHCVLSLFASDSAGWFQIAWLGNSQAADGLVASLAALPDARVPDALVRLVFTSFENAFFRPSWWGALDPGTQKVLKLRRWNPAVPFEPRAQDYLVDDGRRFVDWRVTARYSSSVF